MGEVVRSHTSEVPELLPCGYLVGDNNVIKVNLKGSKEWRMEVVYRWCRKKDVLEKYIDYRL